MNLDMVGMLHTNTETPDGASNILLNGHLRFKQDEAILIDNVKRVVFDADPLLTDYNSKSLPEIVEDYQHRKGKHISIQTCS